MSLFCRFTPVVSIGFVAGGIPPFNESARFVAGGIPLFNESTRLVSGGICSTIQEDGAAPLRGIGAGTNAMANDTGHARRKTARIHRGEIHGVARYRAGKR